MGEVRYYEDVEIGEEFRSRTRTITETDVVSFASLSDDWSEVHISEEFARGTAYGRRIAHGLLGLAITEGLKLRGGADRFAGIASLGWTWDFLLPIRIGDTLHIRFRVASMRPSNSKPDWGIVIIPVELVNQNGEIVQRGEHKLMVPRRPSAAAA